MTWLWALKVPLFRVALIYPPVYGVVFWLAAPSRESRFGLTEKHASNLAVPDAPVCERDLVARIATYVGMRLKVIEIETWPRGYAR